MNRSTPYARALHEAMLSRLAHSGVNSFWWRPEKQPDGVGLGDSFRKSDPGPFFRGLRRRSPIRHRLPTEPLTAEEPLPAVAPIALRALKVEIKFMIWLRKPGSWALLARVASIATEPPCSAF
jgi:hypothetical protein